MTEQTVPAQKKRRFAGTPAQIRSAAKAYKVLAYATGVMLLLVVVEMVAKYAFGTEIVLGGTTADGTPNTFGFLPADSFEGGFNLSTAVLIVHGWMYVAYLIADFRLWSLMRWPFTRFVTIALGGVVPALSFIMEAKVHKEVERELATHPEAAKRY
ncbi:DUF3817 domain-containing protein [Arthrobacter ginkgonis]|uniref:DUF3817 domain-containing protein n=1 Tax=Arthrobacter ginkgonis TaxID=1630594 RepID=A0ABP7BWN1_9MICC